MLLHMRKASENWWEFDLFLERNYYEEWSTVHLFDSEEKEITEPRESLRHHNTYFFFFFLFFWEGRTSVLYTGTLKIMWLHLYVKDLKKLAASDICIFVLN